jgi:nucleoporin POM34
MVCREICSTQVGEDVHAFLTQLTPPSLLTLHYTVESFQPYSTYFFAVVRIILIFNILAALRPLVHRKDDLSDIPLTPAQRRLLGLPPSSTPPTPGSQYVTPPRYPRSTTPQSGSPGSTYSSSPLSGKGSPAQGTSRESPFSPNASPLLSKAIGGGLAGIRRPSYGSPSPLGPGASKGNWLESLSSPSPSTGKGPSVTLNNKWLWERGRRRSGDARVFS